MEPGKRNKNTMVPGLTFRGYLVSDSSSEAGVLSGKQLLEGEDGCAVGGVEPEKSNSQVELGSLAQALKESVIFRGEFDSCDVGGCGDDARGEVRRQLERRFAGTLAVATPPDLRKDEALFENLTYVAVTTFRARMEPGLR